MGAEKDSPWVVGLALKLEPAAGAHDDVAGVAICGALSRFECCGHWQRLAPRGPHITAADLKDVMGFPVSGSVESGWRVLERRVVARVLSSFIICSNDKPRETKGNVRRGDAKSFA